MRRFLTCLLLSSTVVAPIVSAQQSNAPTQQSEAPSPLPTAPLPFCSSESAVLTTAAPNPTAERTPALPPDAKDPRRRVGRAAQRHLEPKGRTSPHGRRATYDRV